MRKPILPLLIMLCAIAVAPVMAQSSKATAGVDETIVVNANTPEWTDIMTRTIRTANDKDLFIDVSLQSMLVTQTKVKSRGGNNDTSTAKASIQIRVLIDGQEARPGVVVFNEREQELSASLGGVLTNCTDSNGDGDIDLSECVLTDEEIELILRTQSANSFNFVMADLSSGIHTISVQAKISTEADSNNGSASAAATIGKGSVTIEEVRMVRGEDIDL